MNIIYLIINKITFDTYIGQTKNIKKRISRHFSDLKRNKHHSIYLQRAYNKYGKENFVLLEFIKNIDNNIINKLEENLIELFGNYNVSKLASGGDLLSNHENKKEIISKMRSTILTRYSNMSSEERKFLSINKMGIKNGMFNKNHTEETKRIMSEKHYTKKEGFISHIRGSKMSDETKQKLSKSKIGKEPWNKGLKLKPLSSETKQKLSEKLKGRLPTNPKKVYCEGKIFDTVELAAKYYSITSAGMIIRLKSKTKRMENFYYL